MDMSKKKSVQHAVPADVLRTTLGLAHLAWIRVNVLFPQDEFNVTQISTCLSDLIGVADRAIISLAKV